MISVYQMYQRSAISIQVPEIQLELASARGCLAWGDVVRFRVCVNAIEATWFPRFPQVSFWFSLVCWFKFRAVLVYSSDHGWGSMTQALSKGPEFGVRTQLSFLKGQ